MTDKATPRARQLGHPEGVRISGEYEIPLKQATDIREWEGCINTGASRITNEHGTSTTPRISMLPRGDAPATTPSHNPFMVYWFERVGDKVFIKQADPRERMVTADGKYNYLTVLAREATEKDFNTHSKAYENFRYGEGQGKTGSYVSNNQRAASKGDF